MDEESHGKSGATVALEGTFPESRDEFVPDRGLRAWLQVLGSFMLLFSAGGMANTYGAYQDFYQTSNRLQASTSAISWIGSTQTALILGLGLITGPLYDNGYFFQLVWAGSFLIILGQMMLSLCSSYWQTFAAQTLCMGIGGGLVFSPSLSILAAYFDQRIELAMGIAASGAGIGGVVLPMMFNRMISTVKFEWTVRAMGLVLAFSICIALAVFRPYPQPRSRRPWLKLVDWQMFREAASVSLLLGVLLTSITIYIPPFYIQTYASSNHVANDALVLAILPVFTACNVVGCICLNTVAKRVGPFNVLAFSVLVSGCLVFTLFDLQNKGTLVAYSILGGFFSASIYSLPPACYVKLAPAPEVVGSRMGMGYAAMMIGGLVGPPIAGALLDRYGFDAVWVISGAGSIAGALLMILSRVLYRGIVIFARV
ncbi:putative transporter MCH4 [Penicillium rolfsii]|nr:putative transporter MCH4 [Penicillium rolfsii]